RQHLPTKLWHLVNSPCVRSMRWDSQGCPSTTPCWSGSCSARVAPGPNSFQATHFDSFVRQLNLYGFHKVPGDAGGWLHFRIANLVRNRPELLLHIQRLTRANRQQLAAGLEVRSRQPSRFQQ
ncbi:HSF5 protein, partial [Erithacus rubecula]|nr:HSF5 protein [Erithacus rubecula]